MEIIPLHVLYENHRRLKAKYCQVVFAVKGDLRHKLLTDVLSNENHELAVSLKKIQSLDVWLYDRCRICNKPIDITYSTEWLCTRCWNKEHFK